MSRLEASEPQNSEARLITFWLPVLVARARLMTFWLPVLVARARLITFWLPVLVARGLRRLSPSPGQVTNLSDFFSWTSSSSLYRQCSEMSYNIPRWGGSVFVYCAEIPIGIFRLETHLFHFRNFLEVCRYWRPPLFSPFFPSRIPVRCWLVLCCDLSLPHLCF